MILCRTAPATRAAQVARASSPPLFPRRTRAQRLLSRRTPGQSVVYVAVMLPLFVALIGLAIDGGVVFNARRELQDVADGAARAAAMQIDQTHYLNTTNVALDPRASRRVAESYVADYTSRGGQGRLRSLLLTGVEVGERTVVVDVRAEVPLAFMPIVGWRSVTVGARAPAQARYGIWEGR
jgi:Putative Flp pilus-assembly TadE/G-like